MAMKHIIISLMLGSLALGAQAAKPEHADKKPEKHAKKSQDDQEYRQQKDKDSDEYSHRDRDSYRDRDDDRRDEERDRREHQDKREFSSRDRELIRNYYNEHAASGTGQTYGQQKELPKGLQKKLERGGELPPGWQKKLARGEVLDSGMRSYARPLPDELLGRIQTDADAVAAEVLRIEDKIVRVSKGKGTIIDIIDLADVMSGRGMRPE